LPLHQKVQQKFTPVAAEAWFELASRQPQKKKNLKRKTLGLPGAPRKRLGFLCPLRTFKKRGGGEGVTKGRGKRFFYRHLAMQKKPGKHPRNMKKGIREKEVFLKGGDPGMEHQTPEEDPPVKIRRKLRGPV